ncbi:MAG: TatD family hydrolase [Chitinophagales bacterium]|nr:TatD family hydrolase [Chitinophagales bacterium]
MVLVDTHTHLNDEQFNDDRIDMLSRAFAKHINYMLIPNVDSTTIDSMHLLCQKFPKQIFPMMGLHPCSVKATSYKDELAIVQNKLENNKYIAVGEIGIDLYWDKSTQQIQEEAFHIQCDLAIQHQLPIAIHSRESIPLIIDILKSRTQNPSGVFHCFTGNETEAKQIIDLGFYLGIGGVVTYKNSDLKNTLRNISLQHLVLETDAPYLPPVPYRGKRNESSYITLVAEFLCTIYQLSYDEVAAITTQNAKKLFNLEKYIKNL